MITDPKIRKRRIQKLLERSGGGNSTVGAPDSLPKTEIGEIHREVGLRSEEEALLACLRGPQAWCLLTTERLLWKRDASVVALNWRDVRGVQQPPEISSRIIRGELEKDAVEELEVFDSEGTGYSLWLAPGKAYFLIWSAITALGNLTRPPDPIILGPDSAWASIGHG